jgi:hypothetical protein
MSYKPIIEYFFYSLDASPESVYWPFFVCEHHYICLAQLSAKSKLSGKEQIKWERNVEGPASDSTPCERITLTDFTKKTIKIKKKSI